MQSRYYDPVIGRFINADDTGMIFSGRESLLRYNLFAYCDNNPVNFVDPDGFEPVTIGVTVVKVTIKTVLLVVGAFFGTINGALHDYNNQRIITCCNACNMQVAGGNVDWISLTQRTFIRGAVQLHGALNPPSTLQDVAQGAIVDPIIEELINRWGRQSPTTLPPPGAMVSSGIVQHQGNVPGLVQGSTQQRTAPIGSNAARAAQNHTNVLTQFLQ